MKSTGYPGVKTSSMKSLGCGLSCILKGIPVTIVTVLSGVVAIQLTLSFVTYGAQFSNIL
jgi:hypothetical protein